MTALLKEDGSLDIERINSLPREDKIREMSKFTREQMEEYLYKLPKNESHEPVKVIKVDYKMEDLLARGCGTYEDIHKTNDIKERLNKTPCNLN